MGLERIEGIVLDTVKYSDNNNIVTIFAREQGIVSLLVPAGNSPKARRIKAGLLPLSIISTDTKFNKNRKIQFLGNFNISSLNRDIYFNPYKSAIALFLADFLYSFLRQSAPDGEMWQYIVNSINLLDATSKSVANFHLGFLIELLKPAGIKPVFDTRNGYDADKAYWFDMRDGSFSIIAPNHIDRIPPAESRLLPLLSRMTPTNSYLFKFNRDNRRELLRYLLRYYSIHFPGIGQLKSLSVLADIFD